MAALDFPANPNVNDTYTANGKTWVWNGTSWNNNNAGTVGPTGPGGITYATKSANYTASANDGIIADTSGGSFTITLPATPTTGDAVTIADGSSWSTNNL